jgi:hypothetical protein
MNGEKVKILRYYPGPYVDRLGRNMKQSVRIARTD